MTLGNHSLLTLTQQNNSHSHLLFREIAGSTGRHLSLLMRAILGRVQKTRGQGWWRAPRNFLISFSFHRLSIFLLFSRLTSVVFHHIRITDPFIVRYQRHFERVFPGGLSSLLPNVSINERILFFPLSDNLFALLRYRCLRRMKFHMCVQSVWAEDDL